MAMGLYVSSLLIQGCSEESRPAIGLNSQNRLESSDGWLSLATNAERLKITTLINYLLTIVYLYILAHVIVVLITLVTCSNITFHSFSAAGTLSMRHLNNFTSNLD